MSNSAQDVQDVISSLTTQITKMEETNVDKDIVLSLKECLHNLIKSQSNRKVVKTKKSVFERYNMFPPIDDKAYEFFKMQETSLWSVNEITFSDDKYDFNHKLEPQVKRLIEIAIAFFLPGDGLVNSNIIYNFLCNCETAEETWMFISQMYIEAIHAETYGMIAYTLFDDAKIMELKDMADNSPYMKAKFDFMEKWINSETATESERFLAFSCVEGMSFCVLFVIFFWLRKKNVMASFVFVNGLISKDESLHKDQGGYMHQKRDKLSTDKAMEIVMDLFRIECDFIDWLLPESVEDLNKDEFKEFLKVVTDACLYCNGLPAYFNVDNPYKWLDDISLIQKHNFFETKGAQYSRSSLKDAVDYNTRAGKTKDNISNALKNPLSIKF